MGVALFLISEVFFCISVLWAFFSKAYLPDENKFVVTGGR